MESRRTLHHKGTAEYRQPEPPGLRLKGEIEVSLCQADGHALLSVRDTGIGIPPEALPKLFERFYRVEGAEGRTHEGSRIGLALVRELLESRYEIEAVADGQAAREAARRETPDLIVSDAMMPKMDGFALLRALRTDSQLRDVPTILLSNEFLAMLAHELRNPLAPIRNAGEIPSRTLPRATVGGGESRGGTQGSSRTMYVAPGRWDSMTT